MHCELIQGNQARRKRTGVPTEQSDGSALWLRVMNPLRFETVMHPPAVPFDHGGDGGDLSGALRVRIFRMGLQLRSADELMVSAVGFHSGERERKSEWSPKKACKINAALYRSTHSIPPGNGQGK
jgi:hypothetical protein